MSRRLLGPFNRVEGDLEVRLEVEDGTIAEARVNSPLFRGFEQILQGKDPRDALVYTPRICGICSVSQSVAAARALAAAQGLEPSANGQLATNLILAAENLADHLTHFYLFFMPDFARPAYRDRLDDFAAIEARFKAQQGSAATEMLPARAEFLHITGLLAGKWPHSLALQPGGTTRAIDATERRRLLTLIRGFRRFLETRLFGETLEAIDALDSADALERHAANRPDSDFARFLRLADRLELQQLGRAADGFMSYGAYARGRSGKPLFADGVWLDGATRALDGDGIREDVSHSWINPDGEALHPWQGSTLPQDDKAGAYSWCKAPRLDGRAVEVGAIARQLIDGHPLIADLVSRHGGNVHSRVVARLLELARVLPAMEDWAQALQPGAPFCHHGRLPQEGQGAGLVEAARGSLGHWLRIRHGRILNYQIIAPTSWNFSPRDADSQPVALEQALAGTEVGDDEDPLAIQHIIRSFDPCMVCTVH